MRNREDCSELDRSHANEMLMSRGGGGVREAGGECQVGGKVWLETELARQRANGQRSVEQ